MAAIIDFPQRISYDQRARHAVISEVSALDIANDIDAELQRAITYLEPAHLLAMGHGDSALVRGIAVAHGAVTKARERVHDGLDLLAASVVVDPYLATAHVSGNDAA